MIKFKNFPYFNEISLFHQELCQELDFVSDTNSYTKHFQELNQILKRFPGTKYSSSETNTVEIEIGNIETLVHKVEHPKIIFHYYFGIFSRITEKISYKRIIIQNICMGKNSIFFIIFLWPIL